MALHPDFSATNHVILGLSSFKYYFCHRTGLVQQFKDQGRVILESPVENLVRFHSASLARIRPQPESA